MKIEILQLTEQPLTFIGTCAAACYDTKLKDENHAARIAKSCLEAGHGRNMEFVSITIKVSGISARLAREIYTHIGGAPTRLQASTRYINYDGFGYHLPTMTEEQKEVYKDTMESIQKGYKRLKELGANNDITGYVLPIAMDTTVVLYCNLRMLENMFNQRLCGRALKEFREFMTLLKKELIRYNEEWHYIASTFFVAKCDKEGYCKEEYPCALVKTGFVKHKRDNGEGAK